MGKTEPMNPEVQAITDEVFERIQEINIWDLEKELLKLAIRVHYGLGDTMELERKLKDAPTETIDRLYNRLGDSVPFIMYEYMVRHDLLTRWEVIE